MTFLDLPDGTYFILKKDIKRKKGAKVYYKISNIRTVEVDRTDYRIGIPDAKIDFGKDRDVKIGSHVIILAFHEFMGIIKRG